MGAMASEITSLTMVHSTVCSGADQRKDQSSASLAFVMGIHRWPINSPYKWPVTRKMFPFDDIIMMSLSMHIRFIATRSVLGLGYWASFPVSLFCQFSESLYLWQKIPYDQKGSRQIIKAVYLPKAHFGIYFTAPTKLPTKHCSYCNNWLMMMEFHGNPFLIRR